MKERANPVLRTFDRWAGIPLVLLLSVLKRRQKKYNPGGAANVLVLKLGTIGDTLLLMPVLKAVKEEISGRPGSSMTVICSGNNREVLERYPFIDRLKVFEVSMAMRDPRYFRRFLSDVNSSRYDLVLDFETWSRISAIISIFVKSGFKFGFDTKGQYRERAFDSTVIHRADRHESQNYTALAEAAGFGKAYSPLAFPVSAKEEEKVVRCLRDRGVSPERLVLVHPWSSGYRGYLKEWGGGGGGGGGEKKEGAKGRGAGNFAKLADLLSDAGFQVGVTGSNGEEERALELVRKCPRAVSFAGAFTLGETAALIRKSLLLITVNTGIMHLGAMLSRPMVTINGPAGSLRWGPVGDPLALNIESDMECSPCLNLGFEYRCSNGECMDRITVEKVFEKAMGLLALKETLKETGVS